MSSKVAELYAEIRTDQTKLNSEINGLRGNLTSQLTDIGDRAGRGLTSGITRRLRGITDSVFNLRNALLGGFAAAGAGSLLSKIIGDTAQAEQTQIALATILGDAEKARDLMADLKQFGAETPFEFPELADSAKKLLAFGVAEDTVIRDLRRIGDIASGVGVPINELAELYGKAKVQGRLFAEDINQLTGRGIPIIQELAKQFGVADSEVKRLVESGKIGFPELQEAFRSLTGEGGKFAGMMEAQSKTLAGQWSTLTDNLTEIGVQLGTAIMPFLKDMLEITSAMLPLVQGQVTEWTAAEESIGGVRNNLSGIQETMLTVLDVADLIGDAFKLWRAEVTGALAKLSQFVAMADNPVVKSLIQTLVPGGRGLMLAGGTLEAVGVDPKILAEDLEREAKRLREEATRDFTATAPSETIRRKLEQDRAEASREKAAAEKKQEFHVLGPEAMAKAMEASRLDKERRAEAGAMVDTFFGVASRVVKNLTAGFTAATEAPEPPKKTAPLELKVRTFGGGDQFFSHLQQSLVGKKEEKKQEEANKAMINAAKFLSDIVTKGVAIRKPVKIKNPQPARAV